MLTSLDVASDILEARPSASDVLVIESDIIEDSERYGFDKMNLTRSRRQDILRAETEQGRLPNLQGVRVCVVGAAGQQTDRCYQLEIWTAYFDSAGADLTTCCGPYTGC